MDPDRTSSVSQRSSVASASVAPPSTDGWQQVSSPSKSPSVRTPLSSWSPTSPSGWTNASGRDDAPKYQQDSPSPRAGHLRRCSAFFCAYSQGQNFPHLGHPIPLICRWSHPASGKRTHGVGGSVGGKSDFCLKPASRRLIPVHFGPLRMTPSPLPEIHSQ